MSWTKGLKTRSYEKHAWYMCECECGFKREIRSDCILSARCVRCGVKNVPQRNKIEDFWKWVDKTENCWFWTGARMKSFGYGRFTFNGKRWRAHVLSYKIEHGNIPDGMCVLHKCDVTNCVNPAHLFLGTQLENIKDMHNKGRARGMFEKGQIGRKNI